MATNRVDAGILAPDERQAISIRRAAELKNRITGYLDAEPTMPTGRKMASRIDLAKRQLLKMLDGSDADWTDWHWQLQNRISSLLLLAELMDLDRLQVSDIEKVSRECRWAISPYYAALVAVGGPEGPIWKQGVPSPLELRDAIGLPDPMNEALTSPAPGITRRYPDRLIINVTNQCAMYCRHCQRRRNIGEIDKHQSRRVLEQALSYVRAHREIRDVLVTGGDALLLSDGQLDWLLGELHRIEHVEIKRLGTRTIVTMPQRITEELCAVLAKYPPIYINTQFNHPLEVTEEAKAACERLIKAGVVLGNQTVLLRGVNNDRYVMKKLNQELLKIRVRPYYLFHAKQVQGTGHFITSIDEGQAIMEHLRGYTSGLAVPEYIVNAPGGYGKIPIGPSYIVERDRKKLKIRTWENRIFSYVNQPRSHR
ncbi:MAG: glutamate 2,3-aminomutase [Clostridia bacterium]|nr:glutamate 2,3-aminomutase [Clostridia bacterium]